MRGDLRCRGVNIIHVTIITSIILVLSILVGYWIWSILTSAVDTGMLTFYPPKVIYDYNGDSWIIVVDLMNKGMDAVTIVDVLINGDSYKDLTTVYLDLNALDAPQQIPPLTLEPGEKIALKLVLNANAFKVGQQVEVEIATRGGKFYILMIDLRS